MFCQTRYFRTPAKSQLGLRARPERRSPGADGRRGRLEEHVTAVRWISAVIIRKGPPGAACAALTAARRPAIPGRTAYRKDFEKSDRAAGIQRIRADRSMAHVSAGNADQTSRQDRLAGAGRLTGNFGTATIRLLGHPGIGSAGTALCTRADMKQRAAGVPPPAGRASG